jgi:hypothetical protein
MVNSKRSDHHVSLSTILKPVDVGRFVPQLVLAAVKTVQQPDLLICVVHFRTRTSFLFELSVAPLNEEAWVQWSDRLFAIRLIHPLCFLYFGRGLTTNLSEILTTSFSCSNHPIPVLRMFLAVIEVISAPQTFSLRPCGWSKRCMPESFVVSRQTGGGERRSGDSKAARDRDEPGSAELAASRPCKAIAD